jgi:rubrerythrin
MNECLVCGEIFHEPDYVPGPVEWGEAHGVPYAIDTEIEVCPNCGAEAECFEEYDFQRDQVTPVLPLTRDKT